MNQDETFYTLALLFVQGIGDRTAGKLIEHFGSAREVFMEKDRGLNQISGIEKHILQGIRGRDNLLRAEREIEFLETNGVRAVRWEDPDYPENLRHCPDKPLVFFRKGDFDLQGKRLLSIVGTRQMTSHGRDFLRDFIPAIVKYDPVIISGLAYGIDVCAHQQALRFGLCTVAVLAHGLDMLYPPDHRAVARSILDNGGLISEFRSKTPPEKENFVKRNRIIAGLSEATIVVESAKKGGSLITAELAASYHRDVFAVPGRITDTYSEGCNLLIKSNRAAMITSADDLEYILNWTKQKSVASDGQTRLFADLSEEEQLVLDKLRESEGEELDQLALCCGMPVRQLMPLLLQLEMKRMVRSLPGKQFQAL